MDFLGMGWFEILVILIIGLLVLGPDRVPEYARKAGRLIRQFRKITNGITKEVTKAINLDEDEDFTETFKNDLNSIRESLENDASELKKTLRMEADSIKETVNEGTREAGEALARGSAEIKENLASDGQAIKENIESGVVETARTLGVEEPEALIEKKVEKKAPSPRFVVDAPDENE